MKAEAHSFEEKLLELAYDELPAHEARAVEAHLAGCPRCSEALSSIRGVRQTMGLLPVEEAPEAGLESLLAYAEQAARRSVAGPAPTQAWWRRLVAPLAGVAALAVIGVLAFQTANSTDLSPSKADYGVVGESRRDSPKAAVAEAMPVAPTQNALEPAPAAVQPIAQQRAAGPEAQLPDQLLAGARSPAKSEARKNSKEAEAVDELQAKDAPADKQEELAGNALAKNLQMNSAGGLGLGNIGERAAEYAPPPGGRQTASVTQMAEAPKEAPSMGLSLGSSRAGGKGGYSTAPSASPMPSAPTSRAIEPGRERTQTIATLDSKSSKFDSDDREEKPAGDLGGLLEKARRVSSSDRSEEIRLAQAVLRGGAGGYQRLEALKRLCDAFEALGRSDEAMPYCQAVVREFPTSGAAKLVQQQLSRPRPSEIARKKAKSSDPADLALEGDAVKPAAADSAPVAAPPAPAAAH